MTASAFCCEGASRPHEGQRTKESPVDLWSQRDKSGPPGGTSFGDRNGEEGACHQTAARGLPLKPPAAHANIKLCNHSFEMAWWFLQHIPNVRPAIPLLNM